VPGGVTGDVTGSELAKVCHASPCLFDVVLVTTIKLTWPAKTLASSEPVTSPVTPPGTISALGTHPP